MAPGAPELVQRLARSENNHLANREASINAMEGLGEQDVVALQSLKGALSDSNLKLRKAAAHALGELSTPTKWGRVPGPFAAEAVQALTTSLTSPDLATRRLVMQPLRALHARGDNGDVALVCATAVPDLVVALGDEDWQGGEQAIKTFKEIGPGGLHEINNLARLLVDPSTQCRDKAKEALEHLIASGYNAADFRIIIPPHASFLSSILTDKNWKLRCAAAWALGCGGVAVVFDIKKTAELLRRDKDWATRYVALDFLSRIGMQGLPYTKDIAKVLEEFPGKEPLKRLAMSSLSGLHSELARLLDRALVKHPELQLDVDRAKRQGARFGGSTFSERDMAIAGLTEPGKLQIAAAAEILQVITDPHCPGAANQGSIPAALEALGKITEAGLMGSSADFHSIVEALAKRIRKDKSWRVRLACAEAFANLAITLQGPLASIQRHIKGDDLQMKMAATRFYRLVAKTGSSMDSAALANLATTELTETVRREYDEATDGTKQDYKMGKFIARSIARRLVQAKLAEVNVEDEERQQREHQAEADEIMRQKTEKLNAIKKKAVQGQGQKKKGKPTKQAWED